MSTSIEFWFDFSSPYSYLAGEQIEAIAGKHGRTIHWQPMLLGAIFKVSGSAPLTSRYGPMAAYHEHDFVRSGRFVGVPFVMPDPFPIMTQNTARAALWIQRNRPEKLGTFARSAMRALFVDNQAINDPAVIAMLADACGADGAAASAACNDVVYKDALKANCDQAIAAGVFGVPWIIVDGEIFWGNDRLPQVDRWLATGGF
jgi:2-hydroxychromene-2-carboxylate isomerase